MVALADIKKESVLLLLGLWDSLLFWRTVSFVLLFLLFLGFLFRDSIKQWLTQEQKLKHDKELFQLLDLILPETKLMEMVGRLEKDNVYDLNCLQYVDKFRSSLCAQSKQFLIGRIRKNAKLFLESLNDLRSFMDDNFVLFPEPDTPSGQLMYPNPEIDGGGNEQQKDPEKFARFLRQLNTAVNNAKKSYAKYRTSVKQTINV